MSDLPTLIDIEAEIITDDLEFEIDTDAKYISSSMIPATRESIGGVIIGDNIDVTDDGTISTEKPTYLSNYDFLKYFD
jgi:hypothetical protein